jgi:hypothetical protein
MTQTWPQVMNLSAMRHIQQTKILQESKLEERIHTWEASVLTQAIKSRNAQN